MEQKENFRIISAANIRFFGAILFLTIALPLASTGQEQSRRGSIVGRVCDGATNDTIPLATVKIVGSTLGAATGDDGRFVIKQVPPGSYEVQASAIGYAPLVRRDVVVRAGESAELLFPLVEQSVQVGEVLVTGQQVVAADLPVSTQYLAYKEIHNAAGAFDDVVRTVGTLPGVAPTRADRNDLVVRGGGATENLFLVDNIEIPNIDHFGTQGSGGGSVSFINLEFVENSSFSAGGFGVRYGDKLSSVLSIGMREGRTDKHRIKATLSATEVGVHLEGPVADGGSYLLSARRSYLDPVFKYYGFAFAPYYWDFLGKATYHLGKSDDIEVLGIGAIDKIRFFDDTKEHQNANDRQLFCNQNEAVTGAVWRHGLNDGYAVVALRNSYADFKYLQKGDAANPFVSNISFERETSLRADIEYGVTSTTEFSAGIEGRLAMLNDHLQATIFATGYTNDTHVLPIDIAADTTGTKGAAYAQVRQEIGDLTLTLGYRGDYLSIITDKSVAGPRFSATYALARATKLTASVGRYYQAPSYIWIMANPYNHALTHLKMDQYIVGIEHYIRSDIKVSLEAYQKDYFNYPVSLTRPYIVMVNTGTEVREIAEAYSAFGLDFLQSSGTGFSHGVDLFVEKRLSETPFYGRLTLSYSETMFKALDGVSRPSSNDQRWKLNIGWGYLIDERWEVTSTLRFYTGRPYTPFSSGVWERQRSDYNTARVGVNHGMDVRGARRWISGSTIISLYLDIQNIYNRKLDEPPTWNQAKNRAEEAPSLGIVPSLGISVEF